MCRSINQDEAVAYGAAVQAAVLTGQCSDVLFQDVTPLSLGIRLKGGIMSVIIPKNTQIPIKKVDQFIVSQDNQTFVTISVYEGERTAVKDNNFLGRFDVSGIPPDLRGNEKIDVSFEIDANGILKVSARNRMAGEMSIVITRDNCGLSKDEILRMKLDAERYRYEDQQAALKHQARQALENFVYERRNKAREQKLRGSMTATRAETIENLSKSTLDWIEENHDADTEEFEEKLREVELCDVFQNLNL